MRKYYFNSSHVARLKLRNNSKMIETHTSGTTTLVLEMFRYKKKNDSNIDKLLRAWSSFMLTCPVLQTVLDKWRIAGCAVCKRTEFLSIFISSRVWGPPDCAFWTTFSLVRHLTQACLRIKSTWSSFFDLKRLWGLFCFFCVSCPTDHCEKSDI